MTKGHSLLVGAAGRGRTDTVSLPPDFERSPGERKTFYISHPEGAKGRVYDKHDGRRSHSPRQVKSYVLIARNTDAQTEEFFAGNFMKRLPQVKRISRIIENGQTTTKEKTAAASGLARRRFFVVVRYYGVSLFLPRVLSVLCIYRRL